MQSLRSSGTATLGQPRCAQCPRENERDPLDVIVDIVAAIDPSLPVDLVVDA